MSGTPDPSAVPQLLAMLRGYAATQLVHLAARLDLARLLRDGPLATSEIAARTATDPASLRRALRGLVNIGLLAEQNDDRFSVLPLGAALDDPSLREWALLTGEVLYPARAGLCDAVRTGETPFSSVFGVEFFAHLARQPEAARWFGAGMARESRATARALVTVFDFTPYPVVVDVGGGHGQVISHVLRAFPACRGILQDRPEVLVEAQARLSSEGLSDRLQTHAGSFFDFVPSGGDVYILSWILHDWGDADCVTILSRCRAALGPRGASGRLLVLEGLLPVRVEAPTPVVDADLAMMLLTGGRERTEAEYDGLFTRAGLRLCETRPMSAGRALLIVALA